MALPQPTETTTCLVTGASSGIGTEIARELAKRGHGVTLVARRQDRLQQLAQQLVSTYGVRAETLVADVSDAAARAAMPSTLVERGLEVAVLVNNAGFSTTGPVHRSDHQAEVSMIRTDVEAVVDLCSLFVPAMVEGGRGGVLNVASTAAFQPLPGQAGYGAAKAFVLSYSQALREELKGTGVTCTVLCPGPVKTEFAEMAGFTVEESENSLPKFMWESAADVAAVGVQGLEEGRPVAIPGRANRIGAYLGYLTPRAALLPMLARQHPVLHR